MSNVINLASFDNTRNKDVVLNTIALKLGTTKDQIASVHLKVTAQLMAKVEDGYVMYTRDGVRRAALVVNVDVEGSKFPFIYHADDGGSEPVGLLYADAEFEFLGSFEDYICADANVYLYHALADHIPLGYNGIGVIQAIDMAKTSNVSTVNELGIRRIARDAIRVICS